MARAFSAAASGPAGGRRWIIIPLGGRGRLVQKLLGRRGDFRSALMAGLFGVGDIGDPDARNAGCDTAAAASLLVYRKPLTPTDQPIPF